MSELDKLIDAVERGDKWGGGLDILAARWLGLPKGMTSDAFECTRGAYLGSLDAAQFLHDALLPGWLVSLQICRRSCFCVVKKANSRMKRDAVATSPARAWLLAVLKAKRAKGETE